MYLGRVDGARAQGGALRARRAIRTRARLLASTPRVDAAAARRAGTRSAQRARRRAAVAARAALGLRLSHPLPVRDRAAAPRSCRRLSRSAAAHAAACIRLDQL